MTSNCKENMNGLLTFHIKLLSLTVFRLNSRKKELSPTGDNSHYLFSWFVTVFEVQQVKANDPVSPNRQASHAQPLFVLCLY